MAAGSMTLTETRFGTIKKVKAAWIASTGDTGTISKDTTYEYDGRIIGVCTVPGADADAPDPNYDIILADSDGVDIALGALLNRHTSNTEYVAEASMAGLAHSKLTIGVTAAGSGNKGTIYIYIR